VETSIRTSRVLDQILLRNEEEAADMVNILERDDEKEKNNNIRDTFDVEQQRQSDSDDSSTDLFATVYRRPRAKKSKKRRRHHILETEDEPVDIAESMPIESGPISVISVPPHAHLTRSNPVSVEETDDTVCNASNQILRIRRESKPGTKRNNSLFNGWSILRSKQYFMNAIMKNRIHFGIWTKLIKGY